MFKIIIYSLLYLVITAFILIFLGNSILFIQTFGVVYVSPLVVALISLFYIAFCSYCIRYILVTRKWPTIQGKIIKNNVFEEWRGECVSYIAESIIEYTVSGNKYLKKNSLFSLFGYYTRNSAHEALEKYPEGSEVKIYYNSSNPKIIIFNRGSLIFKYTLLILLGLVIAMYLFLYSMQFKQGHIH
jgi:hypothetical protein